MQILPLVRDLASLIEQPCETYQECLSHSERLGMTSMIDELIEGQESFIACAHEGIISAAVLKMGATGGISQHRHLVVPGLRLGFPMRIEDFFGSGLTHSVVTHLAQTLPSKATFGLYDYHPDDILVVFNPFNVIKARISIPEDASPDLGVKVNKTYLSVPIAQYAL